MPDDIYRRFEAAQLAGKENEADIREMEQVWTSFLGQGNVRLGHERADLVLDALPGGQLNPEAFATILTQRAGMETEEARRLAAEAVPKLAELTARLRERMLHVEPGDVPYLLAGRYLPMTIERLEEDAAHYEKMLALLRREGRPIPEAMKRHLEETEAELARLKAGGAPMPKRRNEPLSKEELDQLRQERRASRKTFDP